VRALDGIRVLDLGIYIAAPYSATVFAEFDADVIKVEKLGTGDHMRSFGTDTDCEDTIVWLSESRNKRSMT
jgi:crotonobetainyl-CoA:carnitine CoA-transferase CaiB-like acyl-CoA transferase